MSILPEYVRGPFEAHLSKQERKLGKTPDKNNYQMSQAALKALFAVLSSFYGYLAQEETILSNPVTSIRQKSKFIRKSDAAPKIRRLSNSQWQMIMKIANTNAEKDPKAERDVFILSCLYGLYLRISELVSTKRWQPTMGDFFQDESNNWWFKTTGKGNKERQIAVSVSMLEALKRYRIAYLNLTPYPTLNEKTPLISHLKNSQLPITSDYPLRQLVQSYFDQAAEKFEQQGNQLDADVLKVATVHWLRHTSISEDVKHRPREHVRDDAGHSSSATTDRYVNVELQERANSAKNKNIF